MRYLPERKPGEPALKEPSAVFTDGHAFSCVGTRAWMARPVTNARLSLARRTRDSRARSIGRGRSEEAAARSVWTLAAPELAIRARLCFRIRNDLHHRNGISRGLVSKDRVSLRRRHDAFAGNDEAVAFAAAPFARPVAQPAARDPAVVGERFGRDGEDRTDDKQPSENSGHGYTPLLSRRGDCPRF